MIGKKIQDNKEIRPNSRELIKLKENFPQFFNKEGEFELDKFQDLLKEEEIDISKEGYGLEFLGKSYAKYLSSLETETYLAPDIDHNLKEENKDSENLYIIGDNIDALKHLLGSYGGKIKCIYIDPPYNTGSDGFVYPDNFQFNAEELSRNIGITEEEAQRILNLAGKSTHSAWLTFIYPRLVLARDLLSEDGVIFISIDDNEQANLKLICDDIFGEENFISTLSVENNPKGRKNSDYISVSSEYLHMYAKNIDKSYFHEVIPKKSSDMTKDENGRWVHNSGKRVLVGDNSFNNHVTNPNSEKNYSVYYNRSNNKIELATENINECRMDLMKHGYRKYFSTNEGKLVENTYTKTKFMELYHDDALEYAGEKIYEKNYNDTIRMKSQLTNRKYNAIVNGVQKDFNIDLTTTGAGTYLKQLFDSKKLYFDAPKNREFIGLLISLIADEDFYVLDFFSGSGTTADSAMLLNSQKGLSKCKYIMVQLPEKIEKNKPAYKAGYRTIDEISRARIEKAAAKIKEETMADIDYGYKLYYLEKPEEKTLVELENFEPEIKLITDDMVSIFDNKHSSGKESIIATWLSGDGYGLSQSTEEYKLNNYKASKIEKSLYIIDEGLTDEDVMSLIKRIENEELDITRLVIYVHSVQFNVLHELRKNLKVLRNNKNVSLIERF
ncbi:DNA methyltransferase [Facklamia sp. P9177]|uniref:site-specific DNA-methyltransferase n=1 Tax=Facklamia sp. P9177 TaxID=3421945 RepID=UPI003D17AE4D